MAKTESLTEFAERNAKLAKQQALKLVNEAPEELDPSAYHELLSEVSKKETEAQRWLELA